MRRLVLLSGAIVSLTSCLTSCSVFTGPKQDCHDAVKEVKADSNSLVPPDSLDLPTVTITVTQTRRVCK
jgi:hypothetical protein